MFINALKIRKAMAYESYPLDLTDVRAYLNMSSDDTTQDEVLTEAIRTSADLLEPYLDFSIRDTTRDVVCQAERTVDGVFVRIPLTPVISVDAVLEDNMFGTMELSPDDYLLKDGPDPILVITAPINGDVRIIYRTGIRCPPAVKTALLTIVRSLYERREEPPLSDTVMAMVAPYARVNI